MNRKKYNEVKQAAAKILKNFDILSSDDLYAKDANTMCMLYEHLKAGIIEKFDVDESELNKILDEILP